MGLYAILLNYTEGVALELIMSAPESKGFHAWHLLSKDRSAAATRGKLTKVENFMAPSFGGELEFHERWLAWEREVASLAGAGAAVLSDEVRIGIVRSRAPSELARYLRVAAIDYGEDYQAF